ALAAACARRAGVLRTGERAVRNLAGLGRGRSPAAGRAVDSRARRSIQRPERPMKNLTLSLFLAAACIAPVTAQGGGMANRGAPTIRQAIDFSQGAKLELSYTALNWAQGQFMERLKDAAARERLNEGARSEEHTSEL